MFCFVDIPLVINSDIDSSSSTSSVSHSTKDNTNFIRTPMRSSQQPNPLSNLIPSLTTSNESSKTQGILYYELYNYRINFHYR